ncbi:MAG: DUF4351 domain-containing protein, partial [Chloroflexales bacterium]|nr:DUF4351 domain-containing protein [Chloroflexales bacterium]
TYRDLPLQSVVLYLSGAGRNDTGQHQVVGLDGTVRLAWTYLAVQLWQMDASALLALDRPGLLALIGQTRIAQPDQILPQVIARITMRTSGELRQRLLEELLLLCADEEVATMAEQLIEREGLLLDTPMMRRLREQGRAEGREEGRAEGREEGKSEMMIRLLTHQIGALDAATAARVQALSSAQLEQLFDAAFAFTETADLVQWLATHQL